MFFEKLGQVSGYPLDFSLATEKCIMLTSIASLKHHDKEIMKHLFDAISNPAKTLILKEFMDNMKTIRLDNDNIHQYFVLTAKKSQIHTGFYRNSGPNTFMFKTNRTFIIGNKKELTSIQI
ncbi:hypothetical protein GGR08_001446 [Bartonella fuyuanensis]|uniref:Uncharacterized protein n=1 Tax=Bartonella fuyuanensis TaxID=1460968 RepID=A0A840E5R7_9HYPH|nr:hypothetical protein [Bartonella fuyuanensis]MBB4077129.1 hypothetical protein [Bartonella fuyuanensis]